MDIATISILIAIIVCITGLGEWIRTVKNDAGCVAAHVKSLQTKVEHLEEHLEELEEEEENIGAIVQEILENRAICEKTLASVQEKLQL